MQEKPTTAVVWVVVITALMLVAGVCCVWSTTRRIQGEIMLPAEDAMKELERELEEQAEKEAQKRAEQMQQAQTIKDQIKAAQNDAERKVADEAAKQLQEEANQAAEKAEQELSQTQEMMEKDDLDAAEKAKLEKQEAAQQQELDAARGQKSKLENELKQEEGDAGKEAGDAGKDAGKDAGQDATTDDFENVNSIQEAEDVPEAEQKEALKQNDLEEADDAKLGEETKPADEEELDKAKKKAEDDDDGMDDDELDEDMDGKAKKMGTTMKKVLAGIVVLAGISVGMAIYLSNKYSGCYYMDDGKRKKCPGTSKKTKSSDCEGETCVFCRYDQQYTGHFWVHSATATTTATDVNNRHVDYSEGCIAKSMSECPPPNHYHVLPAGGGVCSTAPTPPTGDAYKTRTCSPPSPPKTNATSLSQLQTMCKAPQYTGLNSTKIGPSMWYLSKGKGRAIFKGMAKGSGAQQWILKMNSGKKGCMEYGGIWNKAGCLVGGTIDTKATSASDCTKAGGTWLGDGFVCVTKNGISKGIDSATKCKAAGGTWGESLGKHNCSFICGLKHWGHDLYEAGVDIYTAGKDLVEGAFDLLKWLPYIIGGVVAVMIIIGLSQIKTGKHNEQLQTSGGEVEMSQQMPPHGAEMPPYGAEMPPNGAQMPPNVTQPMPSYGSQPPMALPYNSL